MQAIPRSKISCANQRDDNFRELGWSDRAMKRWPIAATLRHATQETADTLADEIRERTLPRLSGGVDYPDGESDSGATLIVG